MAMTTTPDGIPVVDILEDYKFNPLLLERISVRKAKPPPLHLADPDPSWPAAFALLSSTIRTALQESDGDVEGEGKRGGFVSIRHVGSTSVPGLPAKPVIDIDLVVPDVADEPSYVAQLEAAGFQFLIREPHWHGHRFFCSLEPLPPCNLHVWPPRCPEVERHRVFRDWLARSDEDRRLYLEAKRGAVSATVEEGGDVMAYNKKKEDVIRGILRRAFQDAGYLE